ncbi:hypothetical protein HYV71_00435 [Candidatus Uhrbacteria bacterium]|nr:hypothetical protein [Candidatus Uhrbacteria bacterium]
MAKVQFQSKRVLTALAALIGVCSFAFTAYVIFFSPYLSIEYLVVDAKGIEESDVRSAIFQYMDDSQGLLKRSNMLIFDTHDAGTLLRDTFQVEQLLMKKRYPSTIEISIVAKPFRLIAYQGGSFYDITTRGAITREIDPESIEFYPSFMLAYEQRGRGSLSKPLDHEVPSIPLLYFDNDSTRLKLSSQPLSVDQIGHIGEMKRLMDSTKIKAIFFRIQDNEPEYAAMTKYGWEARYTTLASPQAQFDRLQSLFNEKLSDRKREIDYVDLRFGNKVYYRFQ